VFVDAVDAWVLQNPWLFWMALAVLLVTMIAMACCESVTRSVPMNYICLFLFTVAMSFFLGITSARFSASEVLLGVGITIAVVLALTLFAFQTKWDFTVMGGMAVVLMMILLVFGIVVWFFPGRTLILVYASLGALLFSLFLVIDTQAVIGGKHKYQISSEEYVFAALTLYLDIINLFTFILTIIGILND
jgi:protein lifeguard